MNHKIRPRAARLKLLPGYTVEGQRRAWRTRQSKRRNLTGKLDLGLVRAGWEARERRDQPDAVVAQCVEQREALNCLGVRDLIASEEMDPVWHDDERYGAPSSCRWSRTPSSLTRARNVVRRGVGSFFSQKDVALVVELADLDPEAMREGLATFMGRGTKRTRRRYCSIYGAAVAGRAPAHANNIRGTGFRL